MSATPRQFYFDSLMDVRLEITTRLRIAKAVPAQEDFFLSCHESFRDGVNYGQQVRESAPLATLKGNNTRKYAHAIVDRTCAGRYELTFYIA